MTKNPHRCETCDDFSHVKRKIYAGKNCPSCHCHLEQEIELPACKGEAINSSVVWTSNDHGLCCHSSFKDMISALPNIIEKDCDRLTVPERQAYRKAKLCERGFRKGEE